MKEPHSRSRPPKGPAKGKAQLQDDSIMGTNNSSIVSKRSVERLYFPNEPHYFRYFVKKPQRRAPLINRGYWLRMKAIDHTVHRFLEAPSNKRKVVINLGCGYDPLPWQCFSRYPASCSNAIFVDVDYRDLIVRKRDTVQNTKELSSALTNLEILEGDVLLLSDQYIQLGCDLRNISHLDKTLSNVIDIESSLILLTAEVSITYMQAEYSNELIRWASKLPDSQFCLLEQLLPDGIDHPFAETMMAHFSKLQTPLGSVNAYPTSHSQEKRFRDLGWVNVAARNLWELWSASDFLTLNERTSLDSIEPFDEWEEFALFACHYFLLIADNKTIGSINGGLKISQVEPPGRIATGAEMVYSENPKARGYRKFAAALPIRGPTSLQDDIGNFAGMGLNTRMNSCDLYSASPIEDSPMRIRGFGVAPTSRMCHTITDLGEAGSLLIGGRTSPDNALADCWLYHKWLNVWERVGDLPQARYRHSALDLGQGFVLISPGRSSSRDIGSDFFVWSRRLGWRVCSQVHGSSPPVTFGGTFTIFDDALSSRSRGGILAGGISNDSILEQEIWEWELESYTSQEPKLSFKRFSRPSLSSHIARFGAAILNQHGRTYVVGGIVKDEILPKSNEVCSFPASGLESGDFVWHPFKIHRPAPRPLLIGSSIMSTGDSIIVMGGSAVCFSFGTFWNQGCFAFRLVEENGTRCVPVLYKPTWGYSGTMNVILPQDKTSPTRSTEQSQVSVPRARIARADDFGQILKANRPVILEGLDIGPCTKMWSTSYLKEKVGVEREVVVHAASSTQMDFQSKNFSYVTKPFGQFIEQVENGGKLYMRSLSSTKPSDIPADISKDFPSLAADFRLPPELSMILENFHSSPLRISGPVNMWLHYDVMANVLCQVRGSKRLFLFPPSDVTLFDFEPGASSSPTNVFEGLSKDLLTAAHFHEAMLNPGNVLFIPPLWLHTTSPTSGFSIAVNVFFSQLIKQAHGRDVYGNRDLQVYEKGRQDITKIINTFEGLPGEARGFYLQRLVEEFKQKAW